MKNSFNWSEVGFDIIFTARNGKEALDIISGEKPHAVLTDIRMPVMDGLMLLKIIKQDYPDIKTVILSGYNDFEYARKGMEYGAYSYILKPTINQDIIDVFKKIKLEILAEERNRIELNELVIDRKEFIKLEKEGLIKDLLIGSSNNDKLVIDEIKRLNINIVPDNMFCSIFTIPDMNLVNIDKNYHRNISIYIDEYFSQSGTDRSLNTEICNMEFNKFVLIVSSTGYIKFDEIKSFTQGVWSYLKSCLKTNITCGVGKVYKNISNLSNSYKDAEHAIKMSFYNGLNSIYYEMVNDLNIPDNESLTNIECCENNIINSIINIDFKSVGTYLFEYFIQIRNLKPEIEWLFDRCIRLLGAIEKYVIENNYKYKDFSNKITYIKLNKCNNLDEMKLKIEDFCNEICCHLEQNPEFSMLQKIKEYVDLNYADRIRLADIASLVHMSPNYFCMFFKEKTSINFSDYLNEIRIKKAKNLLEGHNYKTNEIAEIVGFYDGAHFCKIFKKYIGMSPIEYRKRITQISEPFIKQS